MQPDGAQTIASFTGTLLRREHALGQKFVQLVFREDDHDVLCVSTDPQTAALPVGQLYRVEGTLRQRGERSFLLEPKVAALKKHWRPIRRVLFVCIVLACVASIGGVAYMQQHSTVQPPSASGGQPAKFTVATPAESSNPASTLAAPAVAPTPAPAPAPATTVSKPKTVVKTTTTATATTPAVAAPVDACTTQTIPFDTRQQASDSVPTGEAIVSGVAGSEQVCTVSGTTPITSPVTEVISTGPAAAG